MDLKYKVFGIPTNLSELELNIQKLEKKFENNKKFIDETKYYSPLRHLRMTIGYTQKPDNDWENIMCSDYFLMIFPGIGLGLKRVEKGRNTFGFTEGPFPFGGWRFAYRGDHSTYSKKYKIIKKIGQGSWDKNTMSVVDGAKKAGLEKFLEMIKRESDSTELHIEGLNKSDDERKTEAERGEILFDECPILSCLHDSENERKEIDHGGFDRFERFVCNYMTYVDPIFKREINYDGPVFGSFNLSENVKVKIRDDSENQ